MVDMYMLRILPCLLLLCLFCTPIQAEQPHVVKKLHDHSSRGRNLLLAQQFKPFNKDKPLLREGDVFVCENTTNKEVNGLIYPLELNQKELLPIFVNAESLAENVEGATNKNYGIYVDLFFQDGTTRWGLSAPFEVGTHDWQKQELVIMPEKPVKKLNVHLLFRSHSGKVKFRNYSLQTMQIPTTGTVFDMVSILPLEKNAPFCKFQIRDVAQDTDFLELTSNTLGFDLQTKQVSTEITEVTLKSLTTSDRAITLICAVAVPEDQKKNLRFWYDLRNSEQVAPNREYLSATTTLPIGANGRLSRYPFAALSNETWGYALGIDPGTPAIYRVAYHSATGELYLAFDLGFTAEKDSVTLRFCEFPFKGEDGMRGALTEYYRIYPEYFKVRVPKQGLWMPFSSIQSIENWEDFGFAFKEGTKELTWDNEQGILTFHYTEPLTWWMPLTDSTPRTRESIFAEARRLAEQKNHPNAIALYSSVFYTRSGDAAYQLRDTPWCKGVVWSINDAPGISEPSSFSTKWNTDILRQNYGADRVGNLAGEYVDSSEGYVTDDMDFRREHFGKMQTPLTFAYVDQQPGIYKGLVVFEYVQALARDLHDQGLFVMLGGTPGQFFWLATQGDVMGTETSWYSSGNWKPMSDESLTYRRVICGAKPYCFLLNAEFDKFPKEIAEKYMKRCLAYGFFPGFFSPNASSSTAYFTKPDYYNRDRDLFKKYIPLCKRVAEAGWKPLALAQSDDSRVYVERFGEQCWTVFNDSTTTKTVRIRFRLDQSPPKMVELLSGKEYRLTNNVLELKLSGEDVAVLSLAP